MKHFNNEIRLQNIFVPLGSANYINQIRPRFDAKLETFRWLNVSFKLEMENFKGNSIFPFFKNPNPKYPAHLPGRVSHPSWEIPAYLCEFSALLNAFLSLSPLNLCYKYNFSLCELIYGKHICTTTTGHNSMGCRVYTTDETTEIKEIV